MTHLDLGGRRFDITTAAVVVGILNRTPDSFYDQGSYFGFDDFVRKADTLVTDGADVLDVGGVKAGLMTLTGGRMPGGKIAMARDADVERRPSLPVGAPVGGISKVDAVFKSGNSTRDTIPTHLIVGRDVPADVAEFYARMCPAGVYELSDGGLRVNAPNCVDCKATDVLGPRWTPREGGSGPRYKRM